LFEGECVAECPAGFIEVGTGSFSRKCVAPERHRRNLLVAKESKESAKQQKEVDEFGSMLVNSVGFAAMFAMFVIGVVVLRALRETDSPSLPQTRPITAAAQSCAVASTDTFLFIPSSEAANGSV
jgi:hypothetical protein